METKFQRSFGLLFLVLVMASLIGCAVQKEVVKKELEQKESMQTDSPIVAKGYVKFLLSGLKPPENVEFYLSDKDNASAFNLYAKGVWKLEWKVRIGKNQTQEEVGMQIAKNPGTYKFLVQGDGLMAEKITLDSHTGALVGSISVQEGMVIPIRLSIEKIYELASPDGTKIKLGVMQVTVEKPYPFSQEPKKK